MEINDFGELALDSDRPKQNRWRFHFSPLPMTLYTKLSKSERRSAIKQIYHI
jgi:hypothetical protein